MKEIHLFILWENARYKEKEILEDIKKDFNIIGLYNIKWSKEKFSNNLSRFYGTNLPKNSGKEQHCGNGDFLLIIVEVENPVYEIRNTSKGPQNVNINMFDKKAYYRELTGGGHKIHATNSETETNHDLTLLLGKNVKDYLKEVKNNEKIELVNLEQDILGANGFKNVSEMFYALNNCINYAIIRNYETLPEEIYVNEHNDIDIICDSLENTAYILNGEKVFKEDYRVHYKVYVEDRYAFFDLRYIGDSYYDYKMEKEILKNREYNEKGFYTISNEEYFYALIYHAILHKPKFADDYKKRLVKMNPTSKGLENEEDFQKILSEWLLEKGYMITRPEDFSVQFNVNNVKKFDKQLFCVNSEERIKCMKMEEQILNYINQYDEKEYPNILKNDDRIEIVMALSEIRKNIISWYPFSKESAVLELDADFGQITGELCDKVKEVVALEQDENKRQAILKRHNKKENLKVISNLNEIEGKFDYVIIIGVERSNKSLKKTLNNIKKYLKEDAKILIAVENKFSLNNISKLEENQKTILDKIGKNKYSLERLISEIDNAGFKNKKVYYPMTDYKLTNVIFTNKEAMSENNISRNIVYNNEKTIKLFEQNELYNELLKEKNSLTKELANSFFVEIFNKEYEENGINFVAFSNMRKKEYRIKTVMKNDFVYKYPENDSSIRHIQKVKENIDIMKNSNLKTIDNYDEEKIISKYTEAETLDKILLKTIRVNKDETINLILRFKQELLEKLENGNKNNNVFDKYKIEYDKEILDHMKIAKYGLWDLTFQNCFYIDNEFYFYDQEWREENTPIEFILFRAIKYFNEIKEFISTEEIYEKLELNEEKIKIFEELDNKIQKEIRDDLIWKIHKQGKNLDDMRIQKLTDNHTINLLNIEVGSKNEEIAKRDQEIQMLKSQIALMEQSKSWKLTAPLRNMRRKISNDTNK